MIAKRSLADYSAYIFDVDGTLLYPDRAIDGAADAVRALRLCGKPVLAVTNNSSLTSSEISRRFMRFGVPIEEDQVLSALSASAQYIARERPAARVHVFGNPSLWLEMARAGLQPTADIDDVEYIVVGNNHAVTYESLSAALDVLLRGAKWVAVNEDRTYVQADGRKRPGVGAFVAALEKMTARRPDIVVGKPSGTLLLEAAVKVSESACNCLYVGDNCEVDVVAAHAAGMSALLVLTGVSAGPLASSRSAPEYVLNSVAELADVFVQECSSRIFKLC